MKLISEDCHLMIFENYPRERFHVVGLSKNMELPSSFLDQTIRSRVVTKLLELQTRNREGERGIMIGGLQDWSSGLWLVF